MEAAQHLLRIGRRGARFELEMAVADLRGSFKRLGLAWSLARHDVIARYRGSILGPFWITLSMGLMVLGIGLLYASLFRQPIDKFLPFVALGLVFFQTMSGIITEGCETFVQARGMLSQTAIPMFTFVWRTIFRNAINLAHHLIIVAGVLIVFGAWRNMNLPLAVVGALLLLLNAGWLSMVAGIVSARFRDIPPVVASIMQFAIFMTPVFWMPSVFPERHAVLMFNPFAHMLQAVRGPLLGETVPGVTWLVLIVMAVVGWSLAFFLFSRTRRRIVHYL
ncbi:MAG: ABC transporter permease [Phenylobacterium sp.]|jgi:ABC-type polysaccharide/polyol phosphate export permease|uniref:ABC transporter permease n=1 Tax=Phenylobacterium sp. TaxID=1871053 RepID=UPI002A36DE10|nr:ABC transporter permease [Phenylobacterium sp.]MDX9997161.1 ABC transporter permease [Phenylobacterium sp.]